VGRGKKTTGVKGKKKEGQESIPGKGRGSNPPDAITLSSRKKPIAGREGALAVIIQRIDNDTDVWERGPRVRTNGGKKEKNEGE